MLTHPISDRRAWMAASIDGSASWRYPLPDVCLAALDLVQGDLGQIPARQLPDDCRAVCADALQPVRSALEEGRGFVIVEPSRPVSTHDAQRLYWIVGQALGQPFVQNVEGVVLYDVRDTGQDLAKGARFSVTNYESSFHTDNSFGSEIVDYVGLLCLQTAKAGGRSQLLSGFALHNELLARHRDALEILYQPFHVDRRGGILAGESPTIRFPIVSWNGRELLFRYLRYWIEAGHEKAGQALTAAQATALNVLDEVLKQTDLRVEFDLKPGQMYFINNRWIFHNRTAFADHAEPERRRHLLRLWLRR